MSGGTLRRAVMGVAVVGLAALVAPRASASAGWAVQTTPNPDGKQNQLQAVSCTSVTACTAVGFAAGKSLAERWDGTGWSAQTTVNPARVTAPVALFGLSCPSTTACTAVGSTGTGTLAERWNGTRWWVQPAPTATNGGA